MGRYKARSRRWFEVLEDRRMLVGDIDFANGIISVDGGGYGDLVEVRFEGNRVYVDLWAGESDGGTDHHDFDVSISNFRQLIFNGFAGDDVLVVYGTLNLPREEPVIVFFGGANNDTLLNDFDGLGGVWSRAFGGSGDDVFYGSSVADQFFGEAGNDTLFGFGGPDLLVGGADNDSLNGGTGDDRYLFEGTNLGTDRIFESPSADQDTIDFSRMTHGLTIDLTRFGTNAAVASSNLTLYLSNGTAIENVVGTPYDDNITGNGRDNTLWGLGGNDKLVGGLGNDYLNGGEGDDRYVFAGANLGSDVIDEDFEGEAAGNDRLDFYNFAGMVNLNLAMTTEQIVNASHLTLRLTSGTGIETVVGAINYSNTIRGNSRDNTFMGGLLSDTFYGGLGADKLFGYFGNDWLYGEGGNDELYGEDGNDHLFGGNGLDTLYGGYHDDYLDGGYDNFEDILWGGPGRDTFVAHLRRSTIQLPPDRPRDYNDREDLIAIIWH